MEPIHLNNAPISEALVDLRVQAAPDFDHSAFRNLGGALGAQYGSPIQHTSIEIDIPTDGPLPRAITKKSLAGYVYRSTDEKLVAQFRQDGFTFSRLRPYSNWGLVFAEAQRLWKIYVEVARPLKVVRSALRYINRLEIPVDGTTLETYLEVPPKLPEGVGNRLSSFLSRLVVDGVSEDLTAIITQALEPGPQANRPSILLDIDVFTAHQMEPSSPAILETLTRIHDAKNMIFFNSIKPKTAELYR